MKKRNVFCEDCGKRLKRYNAKKCRDCYNLWRKIPKNNPNFNNHTLKGRFTGINSPSYIDGRSLKEVYCKDCHKELKNKKAVRCKKCYGITKQKHYYCLECGKKVSNGGKRCQKCYGISQRTYVKRYCLDCGIEIIGHSKNSKRCKRCANIIKAKSRNWYQDKNPNWKGGIDKLPYTPDFTEHLKEEIRFRDKCICQKCGITEEEHLIIMRMKLTIHHIDYDKLNGNKNNLITVCNKCNGQVNSNRDYWYAYFIYKLEELE